MSKLTILTLAAAGICLFAGCVTNPITGETEFILADEQQDIEIGRKYAPEMEKQMGGKIENPVLQNYINSIGLKVSRVSQRPDFEYSFTALNDTMTNAFALPGGYIFITKGMLQKLKTESQLAAILAHETAHVVARDTMEAMSRDIGISLLLSAVTDEQAVLTVAGLTTQIIGLSYSREDEKTADLAGLDYMAKAGYNPYGMLEVMQMLSEEQKSGTIEFLSTHPSPDNRLDYIQQKILASYPSPENLSTGKDDYSRFVLEQIKQ